MKNNQSGRSMVEMLGVLAIIGVLSAGGLAGYSKAMFKHKLNSTMDQLTMLVTNIRTMYGTQENYDGLGVGQAYRLGIISASSFNSSNSTMINPFKGAVTLDPGIAYGSVAASAFVITYTNLPKEACIALATADWGTGSGSGFISVTANNTGSLPMVNGATGPASITAAASGTDYEGSPMTVNSAITACDEETNTVELKFY